jgi:hypothetical protein
VSESSAAGSWEWVDVVSGSSRANDIDVERHSTEKVHPSRSLTEGRLTGSWRRRTQWGVLVLPWSSCFVSGYGPVGSGRSVDVGPSALAHPVFSGSSPVLGALIPVRTWRADGRSFPVFQCVWLGVRVRERVREFERVRERDRVGLVACRLERCDRCGVSGSTVRPFYACHQKKRKTHESSTN